MEVGFGCEVYEVSVAMYLILYVLLSVSYIGSACLQKPPYGFYILNVDSEVIGSSTGSPCCLQRQAKSIDGTSPVVWSVLLLHALDTFVLKSCKHKLCLSVYPMQLIAVASPPPCLSKRNADRTTTTIQARPSICA